jgi:hypothetical protein
LNLDHIILKGVPSSDLPVSPPPSAACGCCLLKLGGGVDGRVEGIVAGLSRLMMCIPKKRKGEGCLSASFRSESRSPGRAISYPWRVGRNFPWMYYAGVENRKGVEESYWK